MSTRLFFRFLILVGTLIFPSLGRALDFRVVSWEGEITGLHFATGKKNVEIMADEGLFSPWYSLIEPGPLVFFREVQQEDKILRIPVVTLTPPVDFTRAILVLAATDASRATYTGIWIDDSLEARPPQTLTVRNLSSHTVALKIGSNERILAIDEIFTFPTDANAQRIPFKMAAFTQSGWAVVANSSQAIRRGRRTLILLRDGRPQAAGIREIIDMVTLNDRPPLPAPAVTSVATFR